MKIRRFALVLLVSSLAFAQAPSATPKTNAGSSAKPQTAPAAATSVAAQANKPATPSPSPAPAAKPAAAASTEVKPDAIVLTISGLCHVKPVKGECKTTMTRAEFDKLLAAFSGDQPDQPPITPAQKRRLATQLAHFMVFSKEAEDQGLDKRPETALLLNFFKLQVLSELEKRSIQKKSDATPEEIAKYYDDNSDRYTELSLERLMIPMHAGTDSKLTDADLQKLADDLRQKATAPGADFKALEAEAYAKVGIKSNPPETKMTMHPNEISMNQQAIKQLKPGEVSSVIKDGNANYIYKLDSKQVSPLDAKLKAEISKTVAQQNFRKEMDDLDKSRPVDYNEEYFGAAPPPPGQQAGRPPMMPPTQSRPPVPPTRPATPTVTAPPAQPKAPAAPAATPQSK